MLLSVTGWGKGKTTSAIGITLRALANKEKVLFVQFLKDGNDGAVQLLKDYEEFDYINQGVSDFSLPKSTELFNEVLTKMNTKQYDLVVLDEFLVALDNALIDKPLDMILMAIKDFSFDMDIYMTGRIYGDKLRHDVLRMSDIATNCFEESHVFHKKCERCNKEFQDSYIVCPFCGKKLTNKQMAKKGREY